MTQWRKNGERRTANGERGTGKGWPALGRKRDSECWGAKPERPDDLSPAAAAVAAVGLRFRGGPCPNGGFAIKQKKLSQPLFTMGRLNSWALPFPSASRLVFSFLLVALYSLSIPHCCSER